MNDKFIFSGVPFVREFVKNDIDNLYIFTDNTDRTSGKTLIDPNSKYAKKYGADKYYPSVTQAVLRGLDNAMPISTQRWYHGSFKGATGRWNDEDKELFHTTIKDEIDAIINEWDGGKYKNIIVSKNGFFNSRIANITLDRTPILYEILNNELRRLYKVVNERI